MNPERWQQVRELLDLAIAAPDTERPELLAAACSGDSELRAEVESLLHSHQKAGTVFLEEASFRFKRAATGPRERQSRRSQSRRVPPHRADRSRRDGRGLPRRAR